jgi:8-oxo-dGTP pyrophosphatase MutT (NUDIX family)
MQMDAKSLAQDENDARQQCGALCWRMHRRRVEVLLITSRDTGRWVIPKGWPMAGLSAAETAQQEAWEEAGVQGQIIEEPLGLFTYDKQRAPKAPLPCVVNVFALRVSRLADKFPERNERRRKWFSAAKAAQKVAEAELRALFLDLDAAPDRLEQIVKDAAPKKQARA